MKRTVTGLAEWVGGRPAGAPDVNIAALCAMDEARDDAISPLFRKSMLKTAPAVPGAVLTTEALLETAFAAGVKSAIVHPFPVLALAKLIDLFYPESPQPVGAHPSAVIHESAVVHPTAVVGPSAVIEAGVTVDQGSIIGPGAVVCAGTAIGKRVRIGPGAVIGHEGFGFVPTPDGPVKVRQVGRVVIEDDVEIGANACVDRATLGTTVVGAASKLDNLVQVGHNGRIGRGVLIAGQAGLAGSVTVGDGALIGGNAGIADHVAIGPRAKVAAKSGVIGDIPQDTTVAGYPAMERRRWLRAIATLTRRIRKH